MNDINYQEEFEKLSKKEIEEGFKDMWEELEPYGEISPGLYRLPGGGYTGKGGWEAFLKALDQRLKKEFKKHKWTNQTEKEKEK